MNSNTEGKVVGNRRFLTGKVVGNRRFLTILKSIQTILLLFLVFFLGYIASYLTNQQIKEYCFNYNLNSAFNENVFVYNEINSGMVKNANPSKEPQIPCLIKSELNASPS